MQGVCGGGVNNGLLCQGSPMFKVIFQPRPLSSQNEAIYCFSVPGRGVSQVWKQDMLDKNYNIDYLVKVVKLD